MHPLVARQLREVLEGLLADSAAVGLLYRGPVESRRLLGWGRLLGGRCHGRCRLVGLFTDGALDGSTAVVDVVVLSQRGEEGEAHLADPADKRLLLHLQALMLQEVRGLVEDLQTLGALERPVMAPLQTLVLLGVREVGQVMATHPTFGRGLPAIGGDGRVVLKAAGFWLEQDAIDCTAQGILTDSARWDGVLRESSRPSMVRRLLRRRWLLLPAFRHAGEKKTGFPQ